MSAPDATPRWLDDAGRGLYARVDALVARGPDAPFDRAARDALALDLFAWQRTRCVAIDRVARAFGGDGAVRSLDALRGVPTDAFKTARIACFAPEHTARVFQTSGTTRDVRGEHALADTELYARAALASGARWLLRRPRYRFVLLAERETDAPHSSLSFMLARFAERWGDGRDPWVIDRGALALDAVRGALDAAVDAGEPVALLGATFALVHLDEALAREARWSLPAGSVAMPTGGSKGRARELAPAELFELIERRFALGRRAIVQEYGMTELSSQAYESHGDGSAFTGRYVPPPWMLVTAVDPVSLEPVAPGREGILRVLDLCNVGSCVAVQTADVGAVAEDGSFAVQGRAPGATPRGCARAIDALLAGER